MAGVIEFILLVIFGFSSNGNSNVPELDKTNIQCTVNDIGQNNQGSEVSTISSDMPMNEMCSSTINHVIK